MPIAFSNFTRTHTHTLTHTLTHNTSVVQLHAAARIKRSKFVLSLSHTHTHTSVVELRAAGRIEGSAFVIANSILQLRPSDPRSAIVRLKSESERQRERENVQKRLWKRGLKQCCISRDLPPSSRFPAYLSLVLLSRWCCISRDLCCSSNNPIIQ